MIPLNMLVSVCLKDSDAGIQENREKVDILGLTTVLPPEEKIILEAAYVWG